MWNNSIYRISFYPPYFLMASDQLSLTLSNDIPIIVNPFSLYFLYTSFILGISFKQGIHQLAQKSIYTALPSYFCRTSFSDNLLSVLYSISNKCSPEYFQEFADPIKYKTFSLSRYTSNKPHFVYIEKLSLLHLTTVHYMMYYSWKQKAQS